MASKEEREAFSSIIEERVKTSGGSYMEAIIDYCEETGLELEVAATLLNKKVKQHLEEEAINLKFLSKNKGKN